jgi:leucine dehydrogenase
MPKTDFPIFESLGRRSHEQLIFCRDEGSGLRAIIGIHNTVLGPAMGGCRMFPYKTEEDALTDVLRLSRGMTYKAAISGLSLGGGKAVLIGDPKKDKNELLLRSFGRFIESLGGRFIAAEDVGTTVKDMEEIRKETAYVSGISRSLGGSGDPSPVTAVGLYSGIRACIEEKLHTSTFEGLCVAVQGVGHVGYHVVGHLTKAGAKVVVADPDADAIAKVVKDFHVESVAPAAIYDAPCDVFAPCALGGVLNAETIPRLKCRIIAGTANNQLADESVDGPRLSERDILYAPDFVVNAGGLINVANELEGYNQQRALAQAEGIYDTLKAVFAKARANRVPTHLAANDLAMERIESIGHIRRTCLGQRGEGPGGRYRR